MIVESRRYVLHPGKLQEYLACFSAQPGVLDLLRPRLRGFWFTESGALNTVHHLWTYESRTDRAAVRASLAATSVMQEFFARVTPMLQEQGSEGFTGSVQNASGSTARGVFDRLSLLLHPGAGGEALAASLEERLGAQFDCVAALRRRPFETAGPLRELQLVLRSDSLAQRDSRWREIDAAISPLADSPLVASLDCQLMLPAPFSPWQ